MRSALLFLDGQLGVSNEFISELAARSTFVVCADGAVRHARACDLLPNLIIGDLDTITQEELKEFESKGVFIEKIENQELGDFEKALLWLKLGGYSHVTVVGIGGGASDHVLTNFSVMLRYAKGFDLLEAYDAYSRLVILLPEDGEMRIDRQERTQVSLIPLMRASGITTSGLKYPLDGETLEFGVRDGLENRIIGNSGATVRIKEGALLVAVELATAQE